MANKTKTILPAALAAAGVAVAAGYYFYVSKNAKKNRRIAVRWAENFKKDVIRHAKSLPTLDRSAIIAGVDHAASLYRNVRDIDRADIEKAASELKRHWKEVMEELQKKEGKGAARGGKSKARSSARKRTAKA